MKVNTMSNSCLDFDSAMKHLRDCRKGGIEILRGIRSCRGFRVNTMCKRPSYLAAAYDGYDASLNGRAAAMQYGFSGSQQFFHCLWSEQTIKIAGNCTATTDTD